MHCKKDLVISTVGQSICYYKWEANQKIPFRRLVQIAHRLAKHVKLYQKWNMPCEKMVIQ